MYIAILSILLIPIIFVSKLLKHRSSSKLQLPPSPLTKLPIIGHLHLIRSPLHRTLETFSKTIGPIFSLNFGSRLVVVVSSPAGVEECFSTINDVVLANRPRHLIGKYIGYNWSIMVTASYGDHWRNLRRVSALEIFSTTRLNSFVSIRQDEVAQLLLSISRKGNGEVLVLKHKLNELSFNIIMRMIAGKRYYGDVVDDEEDAKHVLGIMEEVLSMAAASYPGDFIPFLRWIDYKNYEKRLRVLSKKLDKVLERIIEEHRCDESRNSMVDHLLSLQESQPDYYSDVTIKGLMVVLIFAGSDTSAVTLEWAMSLLLNHPQVLKRAREEIDTVIGQDRLVVESDLSKLNYLQNIIWETLRLFPATPLLLPHQASADCKIGGYDIPAGTLLLVNAWSIHRDPKVWDDPTSFKPERFEGIEIETHKLMPFGMGRRSCPGYGLAQRVLGLVLASLIQCFEWERVGEEEIDLTEGDGLTMPKAEPLKAICKPRNVMDKIVT